MAKIFVRDEGQEVPCSSFRVCVVNLNFNRESQNFVANPNRMKSIKQE